MKHLKIFLTGLRNILLTVLIGPTICLIILGPLILGNKYGVKGIILGYLPVILGITYMAGLPADSGGKL